MPLPLSSEPRDDGGKVSHFAPVAADGTVHCDPPGIPLALESSSSMPLEGRRASMRQMICNYVIGKAKPLIYGQLLSLLLATTGAIQSTLHLDCHLSAPAFSMLSFFLPTSIFCLGRLIWEDRCSIEDEGDGLSMQQKESCGNCGYTQHPDGSSEQSTGTRRSGDETKNVAQQLSINVVEVKTPTVRARPEKRNTLLSTWSNLPPSEETTAHNDSYVDDSNERGSIDNMHAGSSKTKSYSLFGLVPLRLNPGIYAMIAAVDAAANYTTILAFKYTTITSVTLLDALAIPSAIIVSRCFFGRRYTMVHIIGVMFCGVGITLNLLADYHEDKHLKEAEAGNIEESAQEKFIEEEYPHKLAGDMLGIAGGVFFGIANTLQEVAVKDSTVTEYLGCMTLFAAIISLFQTLILEREDIMAFFGRSSSETCSETEGLALFFLFAAGGVASYAGIGAFLKISDAAFFNLSLLTGDAWSVVFSVFGEGIKPPPSFYVALIITVAGVIVYETAPSPVVDSEEVVAEIHLTESTDPSEQDRPVLT